MAYFKTSTDDIKFELQYTQPKSDDDNREQTSGSRQGDGIYELPAKIKDGRIEDEKSKQIKRFMALVIVLSILFVVLMFLTVTASKEINDIRMTMDSSLEKNSAKFVHLADALTNVSLRTKTVENALDKSSCVNDPSLDEVGSEIVFQRRKQFDISFDRNFEDYEMGFGDYCGAGDFWLGLKKLHQKTQFGRWHLRLSMRIISGPDVFWGEWRDFKIHQAPLYTLTFGTMIAKSDNMANTTGTQHGLNYHNRMPFSTPDTDQDMWVDGGCAAKYAAGWWFNDCYRANLNLKMATSASEDAYEMTYSDGDGYKMISWSEMKMIRVA